MQNLKINTMNKYYLTIIFCIFCTLTFGQIIFPLNPELRLPIEPELTTPQKRSLQWFPVGPINYPSETDNLMPRAGRITCIAFNPVDDNKMLLGSPAGGMYKSVNDGLTWQEIDLSSFPNEGIADIVYWPDNPDIIYAATGDADYGEERRNRNPYSYGVIKSTNGGITWSRISLPVALQIPKLEIFKIFILPGRSITMLLSTNVGIYRSINDGRDWLNVTPTAANDNKFVQFTMDNLNTNILFTYNDLDRTLYKSTDRGLTFVPCNFNTTTHRITMNSIKDTIKMISTTKEGGPEIYDSIYSLRNGILFEKKDLKPNMIIVPKLNYKIPLCIDPSNSNIIYLGGVQLIKSINNGDSWIGLNIIHNDVQTIKIHSISKRIYGGTDGGLYYLSAGENNWIKANRGLNITQFSNYSVP